MTIAGIDNKTELVDGTTLDPNSAIVEPMDQTTAAANATKHFQHLVSVNGKTCYVLISDHKSGACQVSVQ